ncbi:MAG: capsid protein [Ruthenibacterium sp.]
MKLTERVRDMIQHWLRIQPAPERSITIRETTSFETNCIRNRIWYRGDASEIEQLFKAIQEDSVGRARFWAATPESESIRKAHSGLPALMVDTLSGMVKSDMSDVSFAGSTPEHWNEIAQDIDLPNLVGDAVSGVLSMGDGAFKISIDTEVSATPIVEFWTADRVSYLRQHGRMRGIVFKSETQVGNKHYRLEETYQKGSVTYALFDGDKEVPLATVPEFAEYQPVVYQGDFMMALPLFVYESQKYKGRGRSLFDSKTDAFDAFDEVISQWIDAMRAGRVKNYIPEDMLPRDGNGKLMSVNSFGTNFIQVGTSNKENATDKIETIQPDICYDALLQSYCTTLDLCLQGIMSPATLGIDVGKMASADAQREKKDITGFTRNAITDALEKVLPQLICAVLQVYDTMQKQDAGAYEPNVTFGEYGAPDFKSRVDTICTAAGASVMSIETQVDELWGASKDEKWKEAEVLRLKNERGIAILDEPAMGADAL